MTPTKPKTLPDLDMEKLQVREDEYMSEEYLMILFSLLTPTIPDTISGTLDSNNVE